MKKRLYVLLSISLVFILCLFSACTNASGGPSVSETPSATDTAYEVPDPADIPNMRTVTVPYKAVMDPVLCGDLLYMAVAKEDRSETDTNRLVAYNLETGEETLLFTSKQELAMMQALQTDGTWLVWIDLGLYGDACNIYMMNLETKEITLVNAFSSEAPSYTLPAYMDGKIYWIEEESVSGEGDDLRINGHVYSYDCASKEKTAIAELHNIYLNNLEVAAKDGKVVWFERTGDNGAYYLYDTETGKTDVVPSQLPDAMNIQYVDGYIFSNETENFTEQTTKHMVDVQVDTKTYTKLEPNFTRFYLTDHYLLGFNGSSIPIYKRTGGTIEILSDYTIFKCTDFNINRGDQVIFVGENAGHSEKPFQGLHNEINLYICDLNELP